ncbi:hypothetical protein PENSPDRAFT_654563 [Peniophora sp. CONT]|nr:hypothetical protein PENSPDRAFT_654563 [Peniophora sp. CONT]
MSATITAAAAGSAASASVASAAAAASASAVAAAKASAIAAALAAELPPLSQTIGALFVGWGISTLVFGMFCLQTWTYFTRYPSDSIWNKMLVSLIWALEVTHQALIGHACWTYTTTDFGHVEAIFLEETVWCVSAVVLLGAVVGAIVKLFLGYRVYKISKGNYLWFGIISSLAISQLGTAIAFSVQASQVLISELIKLKTLGTVSLSLGAATDIVTALVLCFYLHTMRTGYRRSDGVINRLIVFSVNTGALTSAFSLSVVVLYQVMPNNFIFIAIYFLVCKLYSNSCLATLNSRRFVGGRGTDAQANTDGSSHALAVLPGGPRSRQVTLNDLEGKDSKANLQIGVRQEVSVVRDDKVPTLSYTDLKDALERPVAF